MKEIDLTEVRPNLRIQLEIEHKEPSYRMVRGIVIDNTENAILLITDFGEVMEIREEEILSLTTTNFPRAVSSVLQELRNIHEEIYQIKRGVKELEGEVEGKLESLKDAHFLSKYNVQGAKNRLEHSISLEERNFMSKNLNFQILFSYNGNEELQLHVHAMELIDYPQFDEEKDVEKIVRAHAPDIKDWLQKVFNKCKTIKMVEQGVRHVEGTNYHVLSAYTLAFESNEQSFLSIREHIKQGLIKLR